MLGRISACLTVAVALLLSACASVPAPKGDVTLHILALNDFHGNLEPPRNGLVRPDPADPARTVQVPAGGAARLAGLVAKLAARAPDDTIMVAAGDLIGASPLLSSLFHDEPSIESLSKMGLALTSVGNHEFDEGPNELLRMQHGGCHPQDGCKGPTQFKGAAFEYLAASTIVNATGKTLFPPYAIRTFEGIKVGFIGLTLEDTPGVVVPSGVAGLTFKNEAETVNALVPQLNAQGVQAIVVLIHEGGFAGPPGGPCMTGAITQIVPKFDKAVDLVISGHTHRDYICRIDGRLVTSASWSGLMLTDITLTLDRRTGDVTASDARNLIVSPDSAAEDPGQLALIDSYRELAAPLMNRPVGKITQTLTPGANDARESVIGDIVADSMRAAAAQETGEPVDIAFMNSGGLRGALTYSGDGAITYSDLFTVQPFNNTLVAMTLTGRDIEALLDQQFLSPELQVLQVSSGFSYAWRKSATGPGALVPGSVVVNGKPLDLAANYRVVTNNFLADGGDAYAAFRRGTRRMQAGADVAALETWMKTHTPMGPTPRDRIKLAP